MGPGKDNFNEIRSLSHLHRDSLVAELATPPASAPINCYSIIETIYGEITLNAPLGQNENALKVGFTMLAITKMMLKLQTKSIELLNWTTASITMSFLRRPG